MQAITTKYHGATDTRGAYVSAQSGSGKRAKADRWPDVHGSNTLADASRRAVLVLCQKLAWTGTLIEGATHSGYAYVFYDPIASQVQEGCVRILDGHGNRVA